MDFTPLRAHSTVDLELIDNEGTVTRVPVDFYYDASDPYAVAAEFGVGATKVRWVFARELLARGIYEPTGDGDIQFWPCLDAEGRAITIIELRTPSGDALMQAQSRPLAAFVAAAESLVPSGREDDHVDVDRELAELFA